MAWLRRRNQPETQAIDPIDGGFSRSPGTERDEARSAGNTVNSSFYRLARRCSLFAPVLEAALPLVSMGRE